MTEHVGWKTWRSKLRKLVPSVTRQAVDKTTPLEDRVRLLFPHPEGRADRLELFDVLEDR